MLYTLIFISTISVLVFALPEDGNIAPSIVGGTPAARNEFPWLVMIHAYGHQHCAGIIINKNWILTAAHCAERRAGAYTIVAGEHSQSADDGTEQTLQVTKVVKHEKYNTANFQHDIALMHLSSPLKYTSAVKKAKLAKSSTKTEAKLVVAGWGTTESGGELSDVLLKVTVPLQSDSKCENAYSSFFKESEICAGEGGKDSCQGDSGGPLHNKSDKKVVGIVSYGNGCADADYPGVYTKVSHYSQWIKSHMV